MKWVVTGVLVSILMACTPNQMQNGGADGCLAVSRFPTAEELAVFRLPQDGAFALSFIHSVSHTQVLDAYRVREGKIVQVAETFEAHGAGLPSQKEEPGVTGWEQRDGRFIIRMQRSIANLIVRTDRQYRNRLHLANKTHNLNHWPDQALQLTVRVCDDPSEYRQVTAKERDYESSN